MRRGRIGSSSELSRPTSSSWWKLTAITQSCGVHMQPVGAGSRRQTTESHHLGLQVRLQLLLCFRSLSCRADKAWVTGCPLVYQSGRTVISRAWQSESERTEIVQAERLERRSEYATNKELSTRSSLAHERRRTLFAPWWDAWAGLLRP